MNFTETYRGVKIALAENEVVQRHPDGSPDYREISIRPTLNGHSISAIQTKYGAVFGIEISFNETEVNNKIAEKRTKVLSKLHGYIDEVLDNKRSAPWL